MPYRVEISPAAGRDWRRLPPHVQDRLAPVVLALGQQPRPRGVRKVRGEKQVYRLRLGDYRIVYEIYEDEKLALILRVGRRTETTYRRV